MREEERAIIINVDFCISHLYGETRLVWVGRVQCALYHTGFNTLVMSENSCCVFFDTVRSQSTMIMMRMNRLNLICININNFNSNFDAPSAGLEKKNYAHAHSIQRNCAKITYANYVYAIKFTINTKLLNCLFVSKLLMWELIRVVAWVLVDSLWRCTPEKISQYD